VPERIPHQRPLVNISKALSSSQAQTYHKLEFTSETAHYYKQDGAVAGDLLHVRSTSSVPHHISIRTTNTLRDCRET